MISLRITCLAPALILLLTAGCGGGSTGGGRVAEGGIGGTGISTGAVTARGSIIVNGRRFTLASAAITVNGDPATESALRIGRVVTVNGDLGDGIAERVAFVPRLVGPVDRVEGTATLDCATDAGAFTAMQQSVETGPRTIVDCGGAGAIAAGERVLVSGYRRRDGTLVASYVERLDGSSGFPEDQVIGGVDARTATGFTIGALEVAASTAAEPGERVLVRGRYDPNTRILTAGRVIEQPPVRVDGGEEAEVEGIVDRFTDADDFSVNGIPVDARGARFEDELGGDGSGRLGLDIEVEVEGRFDAAGVLVAERVEVETEENVALDADVSDVDAAAGIVRFFGALAVRVTDATRLSDDRDDTDAFGLGDIEPGDRLEVEGFFAGGQVVATRLDREEDDSEVGIEAPVQAIDTQSDPATVTVLGLEPIDVSQAGDLGGIAIGDIVEIQWDDFESLSDPASAIEREEDD